MKLLIVTAALIVLTCCTARADDNFNGQPVGPNLSGDDANVYVDQVVQTWFAQGHSDAHGNITPDQALQLAGTLKLLGVNNLLASYTKLKPIVANAEIDPKERVKQFAIAKAISITATPDDIDALVAVAGDHPLIFSVFVDHIEWDKNAKVIAMLTASLGHIEDIYPKAPLATRYLLNASIRNADVGVQSALQALISDAVQNPRNYRNHHLYPDLIAALVQHTNETTQKNLPDLIKADADLAEIMPTDRANGISVSDASLNSEIYGGLAGVILNRPAICADPMVKASFIQFYEKLGSGGTTNMSLLIPAATSGDKTALAQIVASYNSSPGKDPFAGKYIKTIIAPKSGISVSEILQHADAAVYNPETCLWTVPAGNGMSN